VEVVATFVRGDSKLDYKQLSIGQDIIVLRLDEFIDALSVVCLDPVEQPAPGTWHSGDPPAKSRCIKQESWLSGLQRDFICGRLAGKYFFNAHVMNFQGISSDFYVLRLPSVYVARDFKRGI
jgi:hypothetical protein